MAAVRLKQ